MGIRSNRLAWAISCAVAVTCTPLAAQTRIAAWQPAAEELADAESGGRLLLRSGLFDPTTQRLTYSNAVLDQVEDPRYAIVQFGDAASMSADRLAQRGVTIVGFVPGNAYIVRLDGVDRRSLTADTSIRWQGALRAGYKVDPVLFDAAPSASSVELAVFVFRGESAANIGTALRKRLPQAELPVVRDQGDVPMLRVRVPGASLPEAIEALASTSGVSWIERYLQPHVMNDDSIGPMQANAATGTPIFDRDLIGTGQIVAISDSGLDRNESWFTRYDLGLGVVNQITDAVSPVPPALGAAHPTRKVYGYWVQPGATAYDNTSTCPGGFPTGFHGTHVSGTVAGDRGTTATPLDPAHDAAGDDGMAPNAQILFQDIGNDTTGCLSITDLPNTMRQASAAGAKISSNSWGGDTGGAYSGSDVEVDATSWELEDLIFVVAAGNSGSGANTIGSPGNAKNALTVGALNHGNSTTTAGFSSRGPTDDQRVKPDIMAPGVAISSALGNTNNAGTEQTGTTQAIDGTSMATPTISGSLALLRQYFDNGWYPRGTATGADVMNPNGAMMKAIALNGTSVIGTWPTNSAGWGRLSLENTLFFNNAVGGGGSADARRMRLFERENNSGLTTGEQHEYTITNVNAGQDLRVTLTWFDPEGTAGAAVSLVNNLDLEVVGPGGTNVYKGNVFSAGISNPNAGTADARNTVEQFRLATVPAGSYTLRVKGTAIPGNGRIGSTRQGYALVVSGAIGDPLTAPAAAPAGLAVATNDANGVAISFTGSATQGYQLYRAEGTCASASPKEFRMVRTGATSPLLDPFTQGGYSYAYKVRGVTDSIEGAVSACIDVVSNDACTLTPTFAGNAATRDFTNTTCSVGLSWPTATSNCPAATAMTYRLERSASPYFTSPTTLQSSSATSYNDTAVTGGTPYFYRVTALDAASNASAPSPVLNATPVGPQGPAETPFLDDVDDNTFMDMQGVWRISNTRASTGTLSYHNGGDTGTYIANNCSAITTMPFVVAAAGTLQYDARFNLEANWDGVVVEISTDGLNWSNLAPTGGYPGSFADTGNPPVNACGYPASQGAYSGSSSNVFQAKSSSLASFAGQTVRVRWRFSSDPASEEEGFYLDNVRLPAVPSSAVGGNHIFLGGFEDGETQPGGGAGCN